MAPHRGTPVIALASVFFALMAVATRTLAGQVPAAEVSVLRFSIGLMGAAVLFVVRRRGPDLKRWPLLALRGFFGGGAVLAYFLSIETLGAGAATVLNYSSPVFASVFAFLFLKERPSRASRIGLVLATVGASLVAWSGGQSSPDARTLGVIAGFASPILGGAAMTTIRKVRDDTDSLTVFLAFCLVGLLMSLPLTLHTWVPVTRSSAPALLAVGVLGLLGQLFFTWGMGHTTTIVGSATTQLVPVLAWVLAVGWLHETVSSTSLVGALLCVGGVLVGVVPWRSLVASTS